MHLHSTSLTPNQPIPVRYALCVPATDGPVALGVNVSPHLAWDDVPEGTRSFAILCHDSEVPAVPVNVNQEGKTIPYSTPRTDFFHWVLVDLPPAARELAEGQDSDGIVKGGKPVGPTGHGVRGRNSYTEWFKGDAQMGGTYGGYDGPCPPWNDERIHVYHFTVFALDVDSLDLSGDFSGQDARDAMDGHVLASASLSATYSLYPAARLEPADAPA